MEQAGDDSALERAMAVAAVLMHELWRGKNQPINLYETAPSLFFSLSYNAAYYPRRMSPFRFAPGPGMIFHVLAAHI